MDHKSCLLTIAIPAYNRQLELSRVLYEMSPLFDENSLEILIVDDGSTPPIQLNNIVASSKLKLVRNNKNIGFFENILKTLSLANGKYILLLNDDDFLVNDNIIELLEYLRGSSTSFLSSLFYRQDELYRGKTTSMAIDPYDFFRCSSHSPGLIFSKSDIDVDIMHLRSLQVAPAIKIYPQVIIVMIALAFGRKLEWIDIELVKEGFDRASGQQPQSRGYDTVESRWAQYIAFTDLLNQLERKVGVERRNLERMRASLDKLTAAQLFNGMLIDLDRTSLRFWAAFLPRIFKVVLIKFVVKLKGLFFTGQ